MNCVLRGFLVLCVDILVAIGSVVLFGRMLVVGMLVIGMLVRAGPFLAPFLVEYSGNTLRNLALLKHFDCWSAIQVGVLFNDRVAARRDVVLTTDDTTGQDLLKSCG